MKSMKPVSLSVKTMVAAALAFVILLSTSCARKIRFDNSPVVPAAVGSVKIKKDKNSNYNLDVFIRNLAEVNKLQPPRSTYIVWIETEGNGIKNIGQINSGTKFLSKKLRASLEAVSSFKPRRVFITAEDNAAVTYPGTQEILTTRNF